MAFTKRNETIIRCTDCGAELPEVAGASDYVCIVSEIEGTQTVECRNCKTTGTFVVPYDPPAPPPQPGSEPISVESLAATVAEIAAKLNEKGLIP